MLLLLFKSWIIEIENEIKSIQCFKIAINQYFLERERDKKVLDNDENYYEIQQIF